MGHLDDLTVCGLNGSHWPCAYPWGRIGGPHAVLLGCVASPPMRHFGDVTACCLNGSQRPCAYPCGRIGGPHAVGLLGCVASPPMEETSVPAGDGVVPNWRQCESEDVERVGALSPRCRERRPPSHAPPPRPTSCAPALPSDAPGVFTDYTSKHLIQSPDMFLRTGASDRFFPPPGLDLAVER